MKLINEFKQFALRGNVVDMAVGIIIGAAFGKIVTSLVNDVIMPPLGILIGGVNFTDLSIVLKKASINDAGEAIQAVTLNYGNFIQVVVDFFIVAVAIFLLIKGMNSLEKKEETKQEVTPEPTKEERLLAEIRDLMKK
jgi:large conductance mechanosensitive channel